jgi:hypothetical protein
VIRRLDPRHWKLVRRAFDRLRSTFFTVPGKDPQLYVRAATVDEVRIALGRANFTNSWELSYNYLGEDGNLRRPIYVEDAERPWQQDHARLFDRGEAGVEVHAHREAEPTEYPHAHLHGRQKFDPAVDAVESALRASGLEVSRL